MTEYTEEIQKTDKEKESVNEQSQTEQSRLINLLARNKAKSLIRKYAL